MNFKKFLLEQGLEGEVADKIIAEMSSSGIYLSKEEQIDERYEKLKTQKQALEEQLQNASGTIEELEKNNSENQELQKEIESYKQKVDELNAQSLATQKQTAIDIALIKSGAKNAKAVNALLDTEKIEFGDDGIIGLEEQLENLKESESYLFQNADSPAPQIMHSDEPNGEGEEDESAFDKFINSRY